jgi:putative NIF3 family GTP cyclohydrolase 1 type 2
MAFNQLMNRFRKIAPPTIRIAGAKGNFFQSLAITTGDGCKPEFLEQLKPDAFICGLFNQESVRIADDLGITLFELTSHATENEPLKLVFDRLKKIFNPLELEFLEKEDTIICYNNK